MALAVGNWPQKHCPDPNVLQVVDATFDKATGLWTVTSATGLKVLGRVLIIADGATSK